ncbi:MAG: 30S ribosomal protein S4 [Firmicutes bacterium]|nr:30S ribosomal protein S4 [Bacillota bacterium]
MAKHTGPVCKLCRREGTKLFLKGDRCYSQQCAVEKRPTAPGQHGAARKKATAYSVQLREKQKAKRAYGLMEKQFHSYYVKASKMRGVTGENMLILIERRLDNVIYRMGIGSSRAQSRQIVNHGHITVNGETVNIPSYLIKAGDTIAIKETKKEKAFFEELKRAKIANLPKWLSFEPSELKGKIESIPAREDIDLTIAENMIVELYSK